MRHPTQDGFSLLEVMVGMSILALGLMASTASMVTAINAKDTTADRDLALVAIEGTLEDILTNQFYNTGDFAGFYPVLGLTPPEGRSNVIEVKVEEQNGNGDILRITLEAQWLRRETINTQTLVYLHTNRGG
ncbi:MAG: prepilin-type N-terminal cleavage/methylation domain-containing protein [Planctomycetota bacterium]|jgi:prepilin-type N-terminal cleavage/methylation domain-containing protein|nr:prepilin-type N-terminal cleavage/methylation domain-containing protein [Planctomycetota bacterium]